MFTPEHMTQEWQDDAVADGDISDGIITLYCTQREEEQASRWEEHLPAAAVPPGWRSVAPEGWRECKNRD
uniref:Uncharacterized protein n=1 Tax=Poecilia latipinna TaxID=48699 RepID=A0A3B3V580_9TELE